MNNPFKRSSLIIGFLALSFSIAADAGLKAQDQAEFISDKALRDQIVSAVADRVEKGYFQVDQGLKIALAIRQQARNGNYDSIDRGAQLARKLTDSLQAVVADKHLQVFFSPKVHPLESDSGQPTKAEVAQRQANSLRQNFGFERVEHLDGNVGYLKLKKFEAPKIAARTAIAAMQFLINTDALIIDLRQNDGGHADMVALLTTYLLEEQPVHLINNFSREDNFTKQSWTLPYVPGRRYSKPVFILTSDRTFSAAEQFTYTLQKIGRATVVGQTTRGGAHFVDIQQIDEHFAIMIPVGNATSPITNANWEGTGITPNVVVPIESALPTAHCLALQEVVKSTQNASFKQHLATLIAEISSAPKQPPPKPEDSLGTAELGVYVGTYESEIGDLRIALQGNKLTAQPGSEPKVELKNLGAHQFSAAEVGAKFAFSGIEKGKASKVKIEMGSRTVEARRTK